MNMKFKSAFAAAAALLCAAPVFADWSQDGDYPWGKLDDKTVTQHRKLYKPLSGKKPKIFFLGYNKGMREIAEFRQRFECDFQYWPATKTAFSVFEPKPLKVYAASMDEKDYRAERKRIFDDLKTCDALIIGKFHFADIPADIRKLMLDQVKKGSVMILILRDGKMPAIPGVTFKAANMPANIPFAAIPDLQKTTLQAASLGKGKIFTVSYNKKGSRYPLEVLTPYESNHPLYYEYYYAFLGTLIRQELAKDAPAIVPAQDVATVNGKLPSGAKIRVDYLDRLGKVVASTTMNAVTGANKIKHPADLPASVVLMDTTLLDAAGKVINFGSAKFVSPRTVKIQAVKLDKDVVGKNRKLSWTVTMEGKPDGILSFRAIDNDGRLIYVNDIKAMAGVNKFSHAFPSFESLSAKLNVKYLEKNKVADEHEVSVYFPIDQKLIHNDFQFAIWDAATSTSRITEMVLKQLKASGIDVVMDTAVMFDTASAKAVPRNLHDAGIAYAIYLTRLVGSHKYQKLCNLSLADAVRENKSYLDKNGRPFANNYNAIQKIVTEAKDFGTAFYNLGDENSLSDHAKFEFCLCQECNVRFRKYLKNMYGTIEKLNAQYNSKFKNFDEIKTMSLDAAAEKELLPMWMDFRAFMDYSFTEWHKMVVGQVRKLDKTSPIGIEGLVYPAKSYSGFNLAQMLPNFTFCAPYFISRDIHALKYMGKNAVKSAWFGTYEGEMNEQFSRQPPWRYLFAGLGGAFYWYAGSPGYSNATIFRMDLGFQSQFKHTADEIAKIKNTGIGKLLKDSRFRSDKVAVHYSQACLHAANLNPDLTTWELSIGNMGDLIESTGLDYEYLTPEEIAAGKLKNFKVLFMPNSQALTQAEVKAMKEFVKKGGLLIADFNPGIMDEHGKMLETSSMADVFGPMDKLNVKRYGKGVAVILYDYLDGAAQKVQKGTATGLQRGILTMLKKYANVAPYANAVDSKGNIAEYKAFTNGRDHYLTFLGPITEAGEAKKSTAGAESGAAAAVVSTGNMTRTVTLRSPMHVYDLNNGKYLGKVKTFQFELEPARGRVFAVTAAKAPAPTVKGAKEWKKGVVAKYSLGGVRNPCRVVITSPEGKNVFTRNVSVRGGFKFVPSYDLPAGTYKISVKNIVGGADTILNVNLK